MRFYNCSLFVKPKSGSEKDMACVATSISTDILVKNLTLSPPMSLKFEHPKTEYIFVKGVAGFIAYN